MQARRTLATFIACVILTCLWLVPSSAATQLPIDKPLHFGTDKIVELSADLARHRAYYIDVAFPFYDAEQRARMRNIVGDATRICEELHECGIPTVFIITIKNENGTILKEVRKAFGHYAFSTSMYFRNIAIVRLRPGNYTITIEPIENQKEIIDVNAVIRLTTDARATDLED